MICQLTMQALRNVVAERAGTVTKGMAKKACDWVLPLWIRLDYSVMNQQHFQFVCLAEVF